MLKSPLGDTYFYDFSEALEMEIELDKIAFTAEVKEGLYAGSSFRERSPGTPSVVFCGDRPGRGL